MLKPANGPSLYTAPARQPAQGVPKAPAYSTTYAAQPAQPSASTYGTAYNSPAVVQAQPNAKCEYWLLFHATSGFIQFLSRDVAQFQLLSTLNFSVLFGALNDFTVLFKFPVTSF